MLQHQREFAELLARFLAHKQLVGTYAERMYRSLEYLPNHPLETNHNTVVFRCPVLAEYVNFHASAHGGALATLLDISTTLALFKLNQAKTVSVEMNMSYLRPAPLGTDVFVRAQALQFGRSQCYSQADIFDGANKLLFSGRHVKAVLKGSFLD